MTKNINVNDTDNTGYPVDPVFNIQEKIDSSFAGSLATQELIDYFSALSTEDECMENYTAFCYGQRGWKRKCDLSEKTKTKGAAGHQAVMAWASMTLLNELSLFVENDTTAQKNKKVRNNWHLLKNTVAMRCFKNASVFNNMCSMRAENKKRKESAGKKDLPDLAPISAEEIIENAKKEETAEKRFSSMESIFTLIEKIKEQKKIAEIKTMIGELENLIKELES